MLLSRTGLGARSNNCVLPQRQCKRLFSCRATPSFGHGYDGIDSRNSQSKYSPTNTQPDLILDAPNTVHSILQVLAENDLDGLIPYIPDEVLDVILAQRKLRG